VRRREYVSNSLGSSPTLPIHSETRRAYWRVVMDTVEIFPLAPLRCHYGRVQPPISLFYWLGKAAAATAAYQVEAFRRSSSEA
jgi:hypothetical protein